MRARNWVFIGLMVAIQDFDKNPVSQILSTEKLGFYQIYDLIQCFWKKPGF
ncbi:MAG: hypothetical protein HC942_01300 [Microcoleus sp. SU_5_6]|nr:hypothetical protein [Microcoleus sp. SU_5_6]